MEPVNPAPTIDVVEPVVEMRRPTPWAWIVWFVTALGGVWITLIFGDTIGAWWDGFSSALMTPEGFREWVEGFGGWGPVAFFLAQAVQVIMVPIPGTLFPPVGALAFGPWMALFLSLAGMAVGSAVVFLIARRWGRPLAVRLVGSERIHRYENLMTARGGLIIWIVFLLPLLPDDAICVLAGLSGISFRRFMVIATLGRIPALAAGVFTMAGLQGAPAWVWVLAATVFAAVIWAGFRYGRTFEARLVHRMRRDGNIAGGEDTAEVALVAASSAANSRRDRLVPVLAGVVLVTVVAVAIGILAGVSDVTTGILLVWGVVLAVMVSAVRESD